jgi:uracil-DNA glycosylase
LHENSGLSVIGRLKRQMRVDRDIADSIRRRIRSCRACADLDKTGALCMDDKQTGLSYMYPPKSPVHIMFIAESPPKPGNGFFYDAGTKYPRFRTKVFELINAAGLGPISSLKDFSDKGFYLTDAMNCRWDKDKKKDLSIQVFRNCSVFLEDQIRLFRPCFIVAMGNKAKQALAFDNVTEILYELKITGKHIIKISFPLRAANETDRERVEKLRGIVV